MNVNDILDALLSKAFSADLKGYDPYDGLHTNIPFVGPLKKNSFGRLFLIHFNKRFVLNFRPFLGIKKNANSKAVALFLSGCIKNEATENVIRLKNILIKNANENHGHFVWGYYFPWQSRAFFLPENTPTVVATSFAANALLDLYELYNDKQLITIVRRSIEYLLDNLNVFQNPSGICLSYSAYDNSVIYNASALGLELIARYLYLTGDDDPDMRVILQKGARFIMQEQNPDGSWYYGKQLRQHFIDHYHTAYILESLENIRGYIEDKFGLKPCIERGIGFYINNMFTNEGAPKYFKNAVYPIESHCSGAAIKALCVLSENYGRQFFDLALKVAKWTIENMYNENKRYFYYQKRKLWVNKIDYLRWSQAWMFIGLSYLKYYGKKYGYSFN